MRSTLDPGTRETLRRNLRAVRDRIARALEASRRPPDDVTLVVVTKAASVEAMRALPDLGVQDVGENRVRQAAVRYEALGDRFRWHFIGHLQRNKVGAALRFAHLIHSVDSHRLLDAIDRRADERDGPVDVLLEVNVSGEEAKHGLPPDEAAGALRHAAGLPGVRVRGLMTMAPLAEDEEDARPVFAGLRRLRDDLDRLGVGEEPLRHLSMGMTQDYRVAVEEGATLVRIGSAIFSGLAPVAGEG
jgi:pyridoxal phosphate enzyme (YggS family)